MHLVILTEPLPKRSERKKLMHRLYLIGQKLCWFLIEIVADLTFQNLCVLLLATKIPTD